MGVNARLRNLRSVPVDYSQRDGRAQVPGIDASFDDYGSIPFGALADCSVAYTCIDALIWQNDDGEGKTRLKAARADGWLNMS
jgi:hypothetical protein